MPCGVFGGTRRTETRAQLVPTAEFGGNTRRRSRSSADTGHEYSPGLLPGRGPRHVYPWVDQRNLVPKSRVSGDLSLRRPAVIQLTVIQLTLHVMELPQSPFRFRYRTRMISRSFPRGSDNHLRAFTSASWTPRDFGGYLASNPSAAPVPGENQIQVFYQLGGGCSRASPSATNACQAIGGGLMTQWGNPRT